MKDKRRWIAVIIYAMAMALVESAVVAYLRALFKVVDPYQPSPVEIPAWVISAEIAREAATMIMLAMVGWLAGQNRHSRFGYFLLVFGVWDIFYYVFLVPLTGWPRSVMDWDILFLIPLPWWGPVLAPVLIASLMVAGGTMMSQFEGEHHSLWPGRWSWRLSLAGSLVALYVFMADAIWVAGEGYAVIQTVRPTWFNWPLFGVALALMAAPITDMWWQRRSRSRA
jgi:hypothetical protein